MGKLLSRTMWPGVNADCQQLYNSSKVTHTSALLSITGGGNSAGSSEL